MIDFDKIEDNRSKSANDRVLIIDGLNTYIRVFSSVPVLSETGDHVGGVVGFLRSMASEIRSFNPSRCIIVFDGKGGSVRRRKIYPEYKMNRVNKFKLRRDGSMTLEEESESMRKQMIQLMQYLECLPVQLVCVDNIEADDAIAYLAMQHFTDSQKIRIVSTDRDFIQLVSDRLEVYSPMKKVLYTPDRIREEFGIHPDNYLLYRIVDGDVNDNIPGVPGVGIKTLIKRFPEITEQSLSPGQFLERAMVLNEDKKPPSIVQTIVNSKDILDRNYELMQLNDTDISFNAKERVRASVESEVPKLDKVKFKTYIFRDRIVNFANVDSWLLTSFNGLNSWAIH